MLKWATANILETNIKIESISKEIEDTKTNRIKIFDLKNTVTKILKITGWGQ